MAGSKQQAIHHRNVEKQNAEKIMKSENTESQLIRSSLTASFFASGQRWAMETLKEWSLRWVMNGMYKDSMLVHGGCPKALSSWEHESILMFFDVAFRQKNIEPPSNHSRFVWPLLNSMLVKLCEMSELCRDRPRRLADTFTVYRECAAWVP